MREVFPSIMFYSIKLIRAEVLLPTSIESTSLQDKVKWKDRDRILADSALLPSFAFLCGLGKNKQCPLEWAQVRFMGLDKTEQCISGLIAFEGLFINRVS
jgi:hypothetical protein